MENHACSGIKSQTDLSLAPGTDKVSAIVSSSQPSLTDPDEDIQVQVNLKHALKNASESEERLRKVIDTIPSLAWSSLPDGSQDFLNQRWVDYTGLSLEQANGGTGITSIHPDDQAEFTATLQALREVGTPGDTKARLRRFDGAFRWFLFRMEPLHDETGRLVRCYGSATDIEDLKRTALLDGAEKRLLEMITTAATLSEILHDLCAAIDAHASGAMSFVCLMDANGKQLQPYSAPHIPTAFTSAITPFPIGPDRGSCGTAAFTRQRVIIPDISSDSKWPEELRQVALASGVCAAWSEPLISKEGEVLGTFCISYPRPRVPDTQDLELIEAAGSIARIAIERERYEQALRSALSDIR